MYHKNYYNDEDSYTIEELKAMKPTVWIAPKKEEVKKPTLLQKVKSWLLNG